MSTQLGPLHYSDPRAAQVREPENLNETHAAVHGDVAIYVDTRNETHAILDGWNEIMQAASDKAQEILNALPENGGTVEETQG